MRASYASVLVPEAEAPVTERTVDTRDPMQLVAEIRKATADDRFVAIKSSLPAGIGDVDPTWTCLLECGHQAVFEGERQPRKGSITVCRRGHGEREATGR